MKWSRDHGLTCGLNENDNCQHHRYTEWEYMSFGFEKISKVRKVQGLFSHLALTFVTSKSQWKQTSVTSLDTHTRKFHNLSYHHLPQKWYFYISPTPPGDNIWNQIGLKFGADIVSTWIHHHIKLQLSRSNSNEMCHPTVKFWTLTSVTLKSRSNQKPTGHVM